MVNRLTAVRKIMKASKAQAFLVKKPENVYYLSGLKTTGGAVLLTLKSGYLFVDSRYYIKACRTSSLSVTLIEDEIAEQISDLLNRKNIRIMALEASYLTQSKFSQLAGKLPVKTIKADYWVETIRQEKDANELKILQKAARLADKVMAFAKHSLSLGITEIELSKKIEAFMRQTDARAESFETIVASGPNAALPHHSSTTRRLRAGDTVLIDLGVKINNYISDITRTFLVQPASKPAVHLYETCLKAQETAITKVKAGVEASEIDMSARGFIEERYPSKFGHNLGHGVGLEVHELPVIGRVSKGVLKENMVFTIEPGIYIENKAGVRIEDMVMATKDGCKILTKSPKQLEDIIVEL